MLTFADLLLAVASTLVVVYLATAIVLVLPMERIIPLRNPMIAAVGPLFRC